MTIRAMPEPRALLQKAGLAGFLFFFIKGLCWLLLPVMQEYQMAGQFSPAGRLRTACWRHLRYYLIAGAAGLAFLIYLFIEGSLSV